MNAQETVSYRFSSSNLFQLALAGVALIITQNLKSVEETIQELELNACLFWFRYYNNFNIMSNTKRRHFGVIFATYSYSLDWSGVHFLQQLSGKKCLAHQIHTEATTFRLNTDNISTSYIKATADLYGSLFAENYQPIHQSPGGRSIQASGHDPEFFYK